jgi:hypothetical protein
MNAEDCKNTAATVNPNFLMYMLCAFADYTDQAAVKASENRRMLGFWLGLEQAYLHFLFVLLYEPDKDTFTVISCLAQAIRDMNAAMSPGNEELECISVLATSYLNEVPQLSQEDRKDMAARVQTSFESFVETEDCENLDAKQSFSIVIGELYRKCEDVRNGHINVRTILKSEQWALLYSLDDEV